MKDVKDELINLITEKFPNYPINLQGSLADNEPYPESFFTFYNNETDDSMFYDNDTFKCVWDFTVYFYSIDPVLVNSVLLSVKSILKQNGWIVNGKGYDVMSDEKTHTGRAIDVLYIEYEREV